jgi:DNA-binding NtrC family response regulator
MNEQILIVDDEEIIRDLLTSDLTLEGFVCHQSADADEAFAILGEKHVDLVISDIVMPGKSGVELLRNLKKINPDISVLMITGLSDMNTARECVQLGADDYIAKPFGVNHIISTVKKIIDCRPPVFEKKNHHTRPESEILEQTPNQQTIRDLPTIYTHP